MEDNKEAIVKNTEEGIEGEAKAEEPVPAADSEVDDDIQYTFVVPKGEVYRDPDMEADAYGEAVPEPVVIEPEPEETEVVLPGDIAAEDPLAQEPEPAKTIVADHRRFTDTVNDALEVFEDEGNYFDSEDFFDTYLAANPTGRTAYIEPPNYEATGLPDDDDITYTFVVPRGEVYKEPTPEEEAAAKEAERARRAAALAAEKEAAANAEILSAETKVVERSTGADDQKTCYGLPADQPELEDLAQKQEARRLYKQRKKNRFRTRFYVLITALILLACWLLISNSGLFTIDSIEVKGNKHYTAEEIINMGHASPGHNIIYKANIKETKEFLENNPYIKRAEVRRKLPSTLVIKVTERDERMAFKYDDDYLIMDEDGILLKKTRNKPKTTIIQGVVVSKIKLGEKIGSENEILLDKSIDLIKTMMKSDLYYVKVDMSKEKSIKAYIYDTLIVKTDYDTLMENMKNGRLHLVVEKLFEDGIERGTITFQEDGSASFMPIF